MLKWLLAVAIALVVLTVLSPWLSRYGLGRLPGDLTVRYRGRLYYLPFATTIVLSLALTLLARSSEAAPPPSRRGASRARRVSCASQRPRTSAGWRAYSLPPSPGRLPLLSQPRTPRRRKTSRAGLHRRAPG